MEQGQCDALQQYIDSDKNIEKLDHVTFGYQPAADKLPPDTPPPKKHKSGVLSKVCSLTRLQKIIIITVIFLIALIAYYVYQTYLKKSDKKPRSKTPQKTHDHKKLLKKKKQLQKQCPPEKPKEPEPKEPEPDSDSSSDSSNESPAEDQIDQQTEVGKQEDNIVEEEPQESDKDSSDDE